MLILTMQAASSRKSKGLRYIAREVIPSGKLNSSAGALEYKWLIQADPTAVHTVAIRMAGTSTGKKSDKFLNSIQFVLSVLTNIVKKVYYIK